MIGLTHSSWRAISGRGRYQADVVEEHVPPAQMVSYVYSDAVDELLDAHLGHPGEVGEHAPRARAASVDAVGVADPAPAIGLTMIG